MSEETATATHPILPACRICREPLNVGAVKCTRCDSFQDWRRFLGFSSSILALLIALISVISAAVPVVTAAALGNRSEVELDLQGTERHAAFLAASNGGNRAGRIAYATLDFGSGADELRFPMLLDPKDAFIGPGQLRPITLRFDAEYQDQLGQEVTGYFEKQGSTPKDATFIVYPPAPARLTVQVVQFGGACLSVQFPVGVQCVNRACQLSTRRDIRASTKRPSPKTQGPMVSAVEC